MDPLSLTASIIAVVGVGGQVARGLRKLASLKGAADLILALNNEISDLYLVTLAIQDVYERQRISRVQSLNEQIEEEEHTDASIVHSLKQANETVIKLKTLYNRLNTPAPDGSGTIGFNKMAWLLEQERVRQMQADLRNVRLKLAATLGILNSSTLLRLEMETRRLHDKMTDLHLDQEQRATTQEIALVEPVTRLMAVQQRLELKLDVITASGMVGAAERELKAAASPRMRLGYNETHNTVTNSIRITSVVRSRCNNDCACTCHRQRTLRSPQLLDRFFGILFLGYLGLPNLSQQCDNQYCERRSSPTASVTYFFPTWLLGHAFRLVGSLSSPQGLGFNLRVIRAINPSAVIFEFARSGNVDGMKELFKQGLASPFDISTSNGASVLAFAISSMKLESWQFLLQAGADPYQEDAAGKQVQSFTTPADLTWNRILSARDNAMVTGQMKALFPGGEYLERFGFTLLHNTVLGLNHLDIGTLLDSLPRSDIDGIDAGGRTSLWWAAKRGDPNMVIRLLKHGANANRKTSSGSRPLTAAIFSLNQACSKLILESDCDINYEDHNGYNPLHDSCYYGGGTAVVESLLARGADIDSAVLGTWETPLMCAVHGKHSEIAEYLITRGANVNKCSIEGIGPIHIAIEVNHHRLLQKLLQFKAHPHLKTNSGETILHYAAQYGDGECLGILHTASLNGINTQDRAKGLTALEMAAQRKESDPDWLSTFQKLVQSIESPAEDDRESTLSMETEEYHDAVEKQD